ncbi:hypothetical protein DL93DRAFT_2084726 [Clavulina sp. PMI_390]|nr:hypothetical protein DL93DRAFT_2084726 [Clavulina sp. PMI_390]
MGMVVIVFLLPPAGWFLVKALEWNSHHNRTIRRMQANVGRQGSHNAANPNSSAIPLVNFNTSVNSLPDTIPPAYTRSPPSTISRTSRERRERGELDSSLTEWSIKCIGHPFGPYANPSSLLVPTPPAPVANPGIAFATFTQNVQTIANASN